MKKILLLSILLPLAACFVIKKAGGDFAGAPTELSQNISAGAQKLIDTAFENMPTGGLRDHHTHVVGLDADKGTEVNPKMLSWLHPIHRIKTNVYLAAAQVTDFDKSNEQYVERLVSLIRAIPNHGKYHILAFDFHYNADGTKNKTKSEFYTSNEYIVGLAKTYSDVFEPVISVHPHRKDAVAELDKWAKQGVRWIKWLPNAQGMNPAAARNDAYYEAMKKHDMILLTHVGEEQAVEAEEDQALGNPLLFRRPLDMGVKVVMAHCASLGTDKDFDNGDKPTPSFELFMRMMDNPKYEGLLFGEISAMTQFNRLPDPLVTMLERTDLHHRLVNGSDYPLPAINMIIQTRALAKHGLITKQERKYLNEIYRYNPLLFDFVTKRTLKHPKTGKAFDAKVFGGLIE